MKKCNAKKKALRRIRRYKRKMLSKTKKRKTKK